MPNSNSISLPIPNKYIGKELEITAFPLNELDTPKSADADKRIVFVILERKVSFNEIEDGKITVEEFLEL